MKFLILVLIAGVVVGKGSGAQFSLSPAFGEGENGEIPPPPRVSATQNMPSTVGKFALPHWFEVPADLKARLMWRAMSPAKGVSRWQWSDLRASTRAEARTLNIKTEVREGFDYGADQPTFSPDARRVLFQRTGTLDLDNNHDLVLADLASGKSYLWRDFLFGRSETWAPDGAKIAFVNGSLDTVLGSVIDPPLRLTVREAGETNDTTPLTSSGRSSQRQLLANRETELRIDDNLDRNALAWTKDGDLLAGSSWRARPNNNDPRLEATEMPLILRFENAKGKAKVWQTRAASPIPAPDGKHIAFFGRARNSDGTWDEKSSVLCVAADSGRNRRTLTRLPAGISRAYFEPDGRHVLLLNLQSDYKWDGTYSSRMVFPPVQVRITLTEFDVLSGARRPVAVLGASHRRWGDVEPDFYDFSPLGLSRDGKSFFFSRREVERLPNNTLKIGANTLYAVRLEDGKLLPLAVFPSDLALAPL